MDVRQKSAGHAYWIGGRHGIARWITVGVPERVKGLYRAATAPQQPISLQDKVRDR